MSKNMTPPPPGAPPPARDFRCDGCGVWRAWPELAEHGGRRICGACVERRDRLLLREHGLRSDDRERRRSGDDLPIIWLDQIEAPQPEPSVSINWRTKTVDLWGGESGFVETNPYYIRFAEIRTVEGLSDWLVHIAGKDWFASLHPLRAALLRVHHSLAGRPA